MTAKQVIDMATGYAGITSAELCRRLNWIPTKLSNRNVAGKYSLEEWEQIAKAMNAEFIIGFRFEDGKELIL